MARTATAEKPQTETRPQGQVPATTEGAGKSQHPLVAFKDYLGQRMGELQYALPPHISPDRFTRVALTALQRKPKLLKCTKQSLWNACLLAAQDGLLPDGREGAIVPYGENAQGKKVADIATWLPMIEGLRKKARNSGDISNWEANVVRAKDKFHVLLGDSPKIEHEPYIGAEDPGAIVAAYSIAWLKDGTISRDVMTIRDLNKIKEKSRAQKGPWSDPTFFPEMCKKTVARRHYKQLPHSSDLDEMIRRDDEAFGLEERGEDQIAERQTRRIASTSAAFDEFGKAPAIEHEAGELSEQQTDTGLEEEFEDNAGEHDEAQPQISSNPEDRKPAAEQQPAGAKLPPKESDKPAPPAEPEKPSAAEWPADKTPTSPDEYQRYAEARLAAETDGGAIGTWFKSEPQRKLRNVCNVTKDTFDAVKKTATDRIAKLKA